MIFSLRKKTIGRLERVSIPDFNLNSVIAKIDSGAYNSAIHVSHLEEFERDGSKYIRFVVLDEEHPEFTYQTHETKVFEKRSIRSSTGEVEDRYVLPVTIVLKGVELHAKVSLSDRAKMRYPLLLGRKILKRHFLIDTSKIFTE